MFGKKSNLRDYKGRRGEPIVIASDMRVDSPGHTGLFGSGSTLDMKRNVILDMQIIKVNVKYNYYFVLLDINISHWLMVF